jgi:hypothetical protein
MSVRRGRADRVGDVWQRDDGPWWLVIGFTAPETTFDPESGWIGARPPIPISEQLPPGFAWCLYLWRWLRGAY